MSHIPPSELDGIYRQLLSVQNSKFRGSDFEGLVMLVVRCEYSQQVKDCMKAQT